MRSSITKAEMIDSFGTFAFGCFTRSVTCLLIIITVCNKRPVTPSRIKGTSRCCCGKSIGNMICISFIVCICVLSVIRQCSFWATLLRTIMQFFILKKHEFLTNFQITGCILCLLCWRLMFGFFVNRRRTLIEEFDCIANWGCGDEATIRNTKYNLVLGSLRISRTE